MSSSSTSKGVNERRKAPTSAETGPRAQKHAPVSSKSSLILGLGCLLIGIIGTQTAVLLVGLHDNDGPRKTPPQEAADSETAKSVAPKNADHRETGTLQSAQHASDHRQRGPSAGGGEELFKRSNSGAEMWGQEKKTDPIAVNAAAPKRRTPAAPVDQKTVAKDRQPPGTSLSVAHASEPQHFVDPVKLGSAEKVRAASTDIEVPEECKRSATMTRTFEDPIKRLAQVSIPSWPSDPVSDSINWFKPDEDRCSQFFGPGFKDVKEIIPASALKNPFDDSYLPSNLRGQDEDSSELEELLLKIPGPQDTSYPRTPFQCAQSPSLRDSICVANNIMVDSNKLSVSCGGEPMEEVKGRGKKTLSGLSSGNFSMPHRIDLQKSPVSSRLW